jgi:hypothetical protein
VASNCGSGSGGGRGGGRGGCVVVGVAVAVTGVPNLAFTFAPQSIYSVATAAAVAAAAAAAATVVVVFVVVVVASVAVTESKHDLYVGAPLYRTSRVCVYVHEQNEHLYGKKT